MRCIGMTWRTPALMLALLLLLPDFASGQQTSKASGYLSVESREGYEVFLNGRKIGTTPLTAVAVPAGAHHLLVRRSVLLNWFQPDWADSVFVSAGDTVLVRPEFITLCKISSTPQGARVLLADSLLGNTPFVLRMYGGQSFHLSIEQEGYFPAFLVCDSTSPRRHHVVLQRDQEFWQRYLHDSTQRQRYKKKTRRNAVIAAGVSISAGIASILLRQQADRYYGRYQAVLDSRKMDAYLDKTRRYDLYSGAAFALFEVSFGLGFYFFLKSQ